MDAIVRWVVCKINTEGVLRVLSIVNIEKSRKGINKNAATHVRTLQVLYFLYNGISTVEEIITFRLRFFPLSPTKALHKTKKSLLEILQ